MNDLQIFNHPDFGAVRTVTIDDEPWFVLKDVCGTLGISNHRMTADRLDADEKGVSQIDTLGGTQDMTVINESGLYSQTKYSQSHTQPAVVPFPLGTWKPCGRPRSGLLPPFLPRKPVHFSACVRMPHGVLASSHTAPVWSYRTIGKSLTLYHGTCQSQESGAGFWTYAIPGSPCFPFAAFALDFFLWPFQRRQESYCPNNAGVEQGHSQAEVRL